MRQFRLFLLIAFALTLPAGADVYETQVEQSIGEDGAYAQFKLWVSPGSHPDRLIALTWGSNQCSLDVVNDPGWQEVAKNTRTGLLACFFEPQTTTNRWDRAGEGSGQALLNALPALAQMSGEPQLANARLYMVGDSQGGQFSFSFSGWKPDRVLGFVSIKGGRHEASSIEAAAKVPGLFFVGAHDIPFRIANIQQTFAKGREMGAPWCLAIDNLGKHEPAPCAPLLRTFLQELSSYQKTVIPAFKVEPDLHQDLNLSSRSWFPSTIFKNEWATFGSGKLDSSTPDLSFDSKMPAIAATGLPSSCDLGALTSGEKSQLITIKVNVRAPSTWDSVMILDRTYLSQGKAVNLSSEFHSVSFKLNTEGLPLGHFSGVVPLRFVSQGNSVPGGLNVPLKATVVGDVTAYPSFIYLESVRATVLVKIEIRSKSNETIKLLSCETPRGVSLTSRSKSGSPLALTVAFNHDEEDSTANGEGTIWLHLESTKKWVMRIPFVKRTPS